MWVFYKKKYIFIRRYDAPHHPPDGVIGMGSLHNGIWTGCIGEIQRDVIFKLYIFKKQPKVNSKAKYFNHL